MLKNGRGDPALLYYRAGSRKQKDERLQETGRIYIHVTCVSKTAGRIEEKAMANLHSILLTAGFVL
jgi:hypothetical protein